MRICKVQLVDQVTEFDVTCDHFTLQEGHFLFVLGARLIKAINANAVESITEIVVPT